MKVTVSLADAVLRDSVRLPDIATILEESEFATAVRVFGRGRFASIDVRPESLSQLKREFSGRLVFTPAMKAQAF